MRTRLALRPLPAMSMASNSPTALDHAHRGSQNRVAGAQDLRERLVVKAVLGQLRRFLIDVDPVAVGSRRALLGFGGELHLAGGDFAGDRASQRRLEVDVLALVAG